MSIEYTSYDEERRALQIIEITNPNIILIR